MQNIDQALPPGSNPDWQILGELELTIGLVTDQTVNKWLKVILSLLELQSDFASKLLKSAQDSVSRTMNTESVTRLEHIHLIILVPEEQRFNSQNWGFFRIEKIGNDEGTLDHTIELFLYQEG